MSSSLKILNRLIAKLENNLGTRAEPSLGQPPYALFKLLDIRIGFIRECWLHPDSQFLYCERVDIGEASPREIGSGLQQHVPLVGMHGPVLVAANLKPRRLAGFQSNGMLLAAEAEGKIELLRPPSAAPVGERLGLEAEFAPGITALLPLLNPKKKVLEACLPFLRTDAAGVVCFGEKKLVTSQGYVHTGLPHARVS